MWRRYNVILTHDTKMWSKKIGVRTCIFDTIIYGKMYIVLLVVENVHE